MPASPQATQAPARDQKAQDAIELLKGDHREVKKLFDGYKKLVQDKAPGALKEETAEQICKALGAHAQYEEELFYPAARAAIEAQDLLDEAEVEHASAKELIAQIRGMQPDDALYDAKVTVLGEYIDHHVKEEEGEMFPKVRSAKVDLVTLGRRLQERKAQLLAEYERVTTEAD